jgi:hypothetical protein
VKSLPLPATRTGVARAPFDSKLKRRSNAPGGCDCQPPTAGSASGTGCRSLGRAGILPGGRLAAAMDELGSYIVAWPNFSSSRLRKSCSITLSTVSIEPRLCSIRKSRWRPERAGRPLPERTNLRSGRRAVVAGHVLMHVRRPQRRRRRPTALPLPRTTRRHAGGRLEASALGRRPAGAEATAWRPRGRPREVRVGRVLAWRLSNRPLTGAVGELCESPREQELAASRPSSPPIAAGSRGRARSAAHHRRRAGFSGAGGVPVRSMPRWRR